MTFSCRNNSVVERAFDSSSWPCLKTSERTGETYRMGFGNSKYGQSDEVDMVADVLGITKSIRKKMLLVFSKMDTDYGGTISLDEFHVYMDLQRTPFSDRAFGILDEDKSGELDFHEFIGGIWLIASANLNHLMRFGYDIFDEDMSGSLDEAELDAMFRMMYNVETLPEKVYNAVQTILQRARNGDLDDEKLKELNLTPKERKKRLKEEKRKRKEEMKKKKEMDKLEEMVAEKEEEPEGKTGEKEGGKKESEEKTEVEGESQTGGGKNLSSALAAFSLTVPDFDSDDDDPAPTPGQKEQSRPKEHDATPKTMKHKSMLSELPAPPPPLSSSKSSLSTREMKYADKDDEASDVDDVDITLEQMYTQIREFPFLLDPVVQLQNVVRRRIVGESYWKKMMKRREKQFGNENMDKILFEKKRLSAKKDEIQKKKREERKMKRLKEIEDEQKRKAEEEYRKKVEYKKKFCTQSEKNYREACKGVERARLTLEEAEALGKEDGIDNAAQCAKLRQRLQRAKNEMDAAWAELEKEWDTKMGEELKKAQEKAEEEAIQELTGRGGAKMIRVNAKRMRWVYRLMPRVDDSLNPLGEVTYKQCKERFKREYINEAVHDAEEEVREKFQSLRNEEKQFVKEEILTNPWEEAQDPEAKAKAEEAERQRLAEEALLRGEFMDPEDWILHLSVERTYFQSMDLLEYQQIIKQVPMRTLRMAGIQPVLKYKHLTAEEKKAKAKAEKLEKLKMLQNKNAEGGGGENGGFMSSFGKK